MPVIQLADVKAHLNVTASDDDALITAQIAAAEALLEQQTGKAFLTQTLTASFDRFDRSLEIFRGPVQSITSVAYLDAYLEAQTVDSAAYVATPLNNPDRRTVIYPKPGTCWPRAACVAGAVTVTYSAGYGEAADVPAPICEAIKLLVANWYANREAVLVNVNGVVPMELPLGVADLIAPYRQWVF